MVGHSKRRKHSHSYTRGPSSCLSSFLYKQVLSTKHYTEALRNEASQNERDPFVYVDLFRDAWQQRTSRPKSCHGAVIPYLMVKALAGTSALPPLGSGPSHRNDCAVKELQSQGLEKWTVSASEIGCNVVWHSISSTFFSVSHCRCEWVRQWPMWREGSLHKQLWLLLLSVPQRLQPGDHPEQEVLSRWDSPNESNRHNSSNGWEPPQAAVCFLTLCQGALGSRLSALFNEKASWPD